MLEYMDYVIPAEKGAKAVFSFTISGLEYQRSGTKDSGST
jgi:hypothetical protein